MRITEVPISCMNPPCISRQLGSNENASDRLEVSIGAFGGLTTGDRWMFRVRSGSCTYLSMQWFMHHQHDRVRM